jgi:putative ABC transport system permease protein
MTAIPGLVGVSLVVGGIVIMNIMLLSVTDRTKEIGLRKALGAKRRDILWQFLVEASTLSVVGAGIGILVGLGLAKFVEAITPMPASVSGTSLAIALALGLVVGISSGLYPANRASRLDPIEALRWE